MHRGDLQPASIDIGSRTRYVGVMNEIAILYGTTSGGTYRAAQSIAEVLGSERCRLHDASELEPNDLLRFGTIIAGTSTSGIGDLQASWWRLSRRMDGIRLDGVRTAFFALGDQKVFPDTFVDALGHLHDLFVSRGTIPLGGGWPRSGYIFNRSRAFREGGFVGLALDEATQHDQTPVRIKLWTSGIAPALAD